MTIPSFLASTRDWMRIVAVNVNRLLQGNIYLMDDIPPDAPVKGYTYYDVGLNYPRTWDGASWINYGVTGGAPGTVTSVAATVPTGFSVAGSPIISSGTLAISFAAGYSLPTDASQANWNTAYGWGNHASAGYLTAAAIGVTVQGYDADLGALAGLASTGLIARTGAGTVSARTLTAPAAGITVSNGDGISGNPTLALADDLAALEALSGTNTLYYRSAANTWTAVTIGASLSFSGGTLNAAQTLSSGTYTPTLTNVANIDASTAFTCQYQRVGNMVTVSGRINIDPTTVGVATSLDLTLPVATANFTQDYQAGGTADAAGVQQSAGIFANVGAQTCRVSYIATDNTDRAMRFCFMYYIQ